MNDKKTVNGRHNRKPTDVNHGREYVKKTADVSACHTMTKRNDIPTADHRNSNN